MSDHAARNERGARPSPTQERPGHPTVKAIVVVVAVLIAVVLLAVMSTFGRGN